MLVILFIVLFTLLGVWMYQMYFWDESNGGAVLPASTVGISAPTHTDTVISPTLPPPTSEFTPGHSLTPPPPDGTSEDTPVPATYTPWPTSTKSP